MWDLHTCLSLGQVQEASISWQLGLISAAAFHMGPHLVPFGKRLRAVLERCFDTASQVGPNIVRRSLYVTKP